jgi:predicted amidohydrolase
VLRIALAQFDPVDEPAANADKIVELAASAAADGARMLLAPEGALVRYLDRPSAPARAAEPLDGPFVSALRAASAELGITIAAGTFTPDDDTGRVHNTLAVVQGGELVASYRKLHLYDAFSFTESETVSPGVEPPPVIDLDGLKVGLATCYDLRFPELFRVLRMHGADVLALASAWVSGPGKEEHWLTLLRARAIENTAYVVAADQVGPHGIGRSAAFDPFGLPLLDLGMARDAVGLVDIKPERIAEVRTVLPSSSHTRFRIDPQPELRFGVAGATR